MRTVVLGGRAACQSASRAGPVLPTPAYTHTDARAELIGSSPCALEHTTDLAPHAGQAHASH